MLKMSLAGYPGNFLEILHRKNISAMFDEYSTSFTVIASYTFQTSNVYEAE